jgi:hypothetical protein
MNSMLLGLALSASPATAAHPPLPLTPGAPIFSPHRTGFPVKQVPVHTPHTPGFPAPPSFYPPFAPGAPTPGFPHHPGHRGPMTLAEFARCFQPTPGHHSVWLIHPVTCQPVHVCFNLPYGCGCPKVKVGRRSIEFDYGKREVEIEFHRNGSYRVDYD